MAESFDDLKNEGNKFFANGEYDMAINSYKKCVYLEPLNPIGYSNRAIAEIKAGRNKDAIMSCQEGLKRINKNEPRHLNIQRKLEYRLQLALNEDTKSKSTKAEAFTNIPELANTVELVISEVDVLPVEFSCL